jgi:hypothetical protein
MPAGEPVLGSGSGHRPLPGRDLENSDASTRHPRTVSPPPDDARGDRRCGLALRAPPPRRPPRHQLQPDPGVTYVPTHEGRITWDICPEPRHLPLRCVMSRDMCLGCLGTWVSALGARPAAGPSVLVAPLAGVRLQDLEMRVDELEPLILRKRSRPRTSRPSSSRACGPSRRSSRSGSAPTSTGSRPGRSTGWSSSSASVCALQEVLNADGRDHARERVPRDRPPGAGHREGLPEASVIPSCRHAARGAER